MFWENFIYLCNKHNEKPNPLAKKLGIPSGSVTDWKKGRTPRDTTLKRIADYFGVSIDYLVGNSDVPTQKEKPTDEGRLTENEVVYSRNGKTERRTFTKEQLALFYAMLDAMPENPKDI